MAERQWHDALGVLKVAGIQLDLVYLRRISAMLGVADLLAAAAGEAGLNLRGDKGA